MHSVPGQQQQQQQQRANARGDENKNENVIIRRPPRFLAQPSRLAWNEMLASDKRMLNAARSSLHPGEVVMPAWSARDHSALAAWIARHVAAVNRHLHMEGEVVRRGNTKGRERPGTGSGTSAATLLSRMFDHRVQRQDRVDALFAFARAAKGNDVLRLPSGTAENDVRHAVYDQVVRILLSVRGMVGFALARALRTVSQHDQAHK